MMATPPLGSGISEWKQLVIGRAQRLVSEDLRTIFANDYETNAGSSARTNNFGTVTYDTGLTGGVARLKTGATADAYAIIYNSGEVPLVGSPLDEPWFAHTRCAMRDLPTVSNYLCTTIQDTFATPNEYVSLGYWTTYDPTNLTLVLANAAGTLATVTSVAADLVNFHDYEIGRDIVNDKIYALVDGEVILTLDGPFTNLTTNPCFAYSGVARDVLGDDIELWVDRTAFVVKSI